MYVKIQVSSERNFSKAVIEPFCNFALNMLTRGTFLVVHWLRLHVPNAEGMSLIPGQGTKIPNATKPDQKKKSHIKTIKVLRIKPTYMCVCVLTCKTAIFFKHINLCNYKISIYILNFIVDSENLHKFPKYQMTTNQNQSDSVTS